MNMRMLRDGPVSGDGVSVVERVAGDVIAVTEGLGKALSRDGWAEAVKEKTVSGKSHGKTIRFRRKAA